MFSKVRIFIVLLISLIIFSQCKEELYYNKYDHVTEWGTIHCLDIDDFIESKDSNFLKISEKMKFSKENRKKFRFIFYNNPFCLGIGDNNRIKNNDELEIFLSGLCVYKGKFKIVDHLYIPDSLFNNIVGPAMRIKHNNKFYYFGLNREYVLDSKVKEFYLVFFPYNYPDECCGSFHMFQSTQESY